MSANSPYPIHCLNRYPHFAWPVSSGGYGEFLFRNSGHYRKKSAFPCPVYPISTGVPWFNLDSSAANATRWLLIDCSSEVIPCGSLPVVIIPKFQNHSDVTAAMSAEIRRKLRHINHLSRLSKQSDFDNIFVISAVISPFVPMILQ